MLGLFFSKKILLSKRFGAMFGAVEKLKVASLPH